MDFGKVIEIVAEFFEEQGLPFAVVGAFGLHAYGLTRATQDLDFVAEARAQARVIAFLESLGYETMHCSAGYSNHIHVDSSMGRVDIIYVSGETSRLLFETCATTLRIGRMSVAVPRPEHLAAMKIHAMKNDPARTFQEMADIQFLLRLLEIDEEEIRGYFEKSGLLDRYYEIKKLL